MGTLDHGGHKNAVVLNLRKIGEEVHMLRGNRKMGFTESYCSDGMKSVTVGPQDGEKLAPIDVRVSDICLDCLVAYYRDTQQWRKANKTKKGASNGKG